MKIHADAAARSCPSLDGRRITPHVFRHSTALRLIETGSDIVTVRDWLGHADIRTTSQYLEISVERKRQALERVPPPSGGDHREEPIWKQPPLAKFLSDLSRKKSYVTTKPSSTEPTEAKMPRYAT